MSIHGVATLHFKAWSRNPGLKQIDDTGLKTEWKSCFKQIDNTGLKQSRNPVLKQNSNQLVQNQSSKPGLKTEQQPWF